MKHNASKVVFLLSFAIGLINPACSSGPTVRKDSRVNLSSYHTYQWVDQEHVDDLKLTNPNLDYVTDLVQVVRKEADESRIKTKIDESLRNRGFVPSGVAKPDFYVTYYGKAKNDDWVSTWTGTTPATGDVPVVIFPSYNREGAWNYRDGIVYLTIYDAKTQKPAWTGSISNSTFERKLEGSEFSAAIDDLTRSFKDSA